METCLAIKNILVMGVRNKWSIAWGIVKQSRGRSKCHNYISE